MAQQWQRLDPVEVIISDDLESVNPPIVTIVITFNARLEPSWVDSNILSRVAEHPRFRSIVDVHRKCFVLDQNYDTKYHVKYHESALTKSVLDELLSTPLETDKPYWFIHVFSPADATNSQIVLRINHIIGDGVGLGNYFVNLIADEVPDTVQRKLPPRNQLHAELLQHSAQSTTLDWITRPFRDTFAVLLRPVIPDSDSSLMQTDMETHVEKQSSWAKERSVYELRSISRKIGVTINDLLLAAYTGAVRQYFLQKPDEELPNRVTSSVPVNCHVPGATHLANEFTVYLLRLPIDLDTPQKRLAACFKSMKDNKEGYRGAMMRKNANLFAVLPLKLRRILWYQATKSASVGYTNVQGPATSLQVDGIPISNIQVLGDAQGRFGTVLTAFSYNDTLNIGLLAKSQYMQQPELLLTFFDIELDQLIAWADA